MIDDGERRASPQARICLPVSPNEQAAAQINITETSHNYRHLRVQRFKYFLMRQNILDFPCYREREFFILLGIFRLERVVRETEMCSVIVWLLW